MYSLTFYHSAPRKFLLQVNFSKNRLVSIVPFDWNRVTLCSIRGVDGSDYINASFIDGYLKKNAYIACQGPMISTVEDFWRMVWEKHSCLIVMLCSVKESGKVRKNIYNMHVYKLIQVNLNYHMYHGYVLRFEFWDTLTKIKDFYNLLYKLTLTK